jgi:hypothetical protein
MRMQPVRPKSRGTANPIPADMMLFIFGRAIMEQRADPIARSILALEAATGPDIRPHRASSVTGIARRKAATDLDRHAGPRRSPRARHQRFRPARLLSSVFKARENDVSRNRHPKRVIADEGDLDEDPDDCKPREHEREDEYKIDSQCLAPRGARRSPDSLITELIREQPGARN